MSTYPLESRSQWAPTNVSHDPFNGDDEITCVAGAADLPGSRFVKIINVEEAGLTTGNIQLRPVAVCGANERPYGVSRHDVKVKGERFGVIRHGHAMVTAGIAFTGGEPVGVGAEGKAVIATGTELVVGIATHPADIGTPVIVALP